MCGLCICVGDKQIVIELAELREIDTARSMLRKTPAMIVLRKQNPNRYLRLERLLQKQHFDYREVNSLFECVYV